LALTVLTASFSGFAVRRNSRAALVAQTDVHSTRDMATR
jgi:hypothetical protein